MMETQPLYDPDDDSDHPRIFCPSCKRYVECLDVSGLCQACEMLRRKLRDVGLII